MHLTPEAKATTGSNRAAFRAKERELPKISPVAEAQTKASTAGVTEKITVIPLVRSAIPAISPTRMPRTRHDGTYDSRFNIELQQDVAHTRARSHADTDLSGALHDAHQHDVHDADPPTKREIAATRAQQQGERILGLHGRLENRSHVPDTEIFGAMPFLSNASTLSCVVLISVASVTFTVILLR